MPNSDQLPSEIAQGVFSVGAGAAAGLTPRQLRAADLARPFSGARVRSTQRMTFRALCAAYCVRGAEWQFFSHVTAARLWRMPLPRRFEVDRTLDVSARKPHAIPRVRGVRGHRLADEDVRIRWRYGLPVTDAVSTWCRLGALLSHDDLVAAGDYLVRIPRIPVVGEVRPYATVEELRAAASRFRGPGAPAVRAAARDVREGSDSRRESLLRMLILRGGLPEPELNQEIFDADGTSLGFADMLYRQQRVIVEYDGDQHRTDFDQFERDAVRLDSFHAADHTVIQVRKRGLGSLSRNTISRIGQALSAASARG